MEALLLGDRIYTPTGQRPRLSLPILSSLNAIRACGVYGICWAVKSDRTEPDGTGQDRTFPKIGHSMGHPTWHSEGIKNDVSPGTWVLHFSCPRCIGDPKVAMSTGLQDQGMAPSCYASKLDLKPQTAATHKSELQVDFS